MPRHNEEATKVKFTKAFVEKQNAPGLVYDMDVSGLALRVLESGTKSYVYFGRKDGKRKMETIGAADKMMVSDARGKAKRISLAWAAGEDAPDERTPVVVDASAMGPTLSDLRVAYFTTHAKMKDLSETYVDKGQAGLIKHVPEDWWDRPLASFSEDEMIALHRDISLSMKTQVVQNRERPLGGKPVANRVFATLKGMFNKARQLVGYKGPNPCAVVEMNEERECERTYSVAEMRRLTQALAEEQPHWRLYFQLVYHFSSRKSEVLGMKWNQIDADARTITVKKTKTGRRVFEIDDAAWDLITHLPSAQDGGPDGLPTEGPLFPGLRGNSTMAGDKKAWARICKRATVYANEDGTPTIHALRRTAIIGLAENGATASQLKTAGGWSSLQMADRYAKRAQAKLGDLRSNLNLPTLIERQAEPVDEDEDIGHALV
jgi:integrase